MTTKLTFYRHREKAKIMFH